jgi:hypothetical protein
MTKPAAENDNKMGQGPDSEAESDGLSAERISLRVSIGIPVYNGTNTIYAAIATVLAQSFGDFEIIVYGNASTDLKPIWPPA